MMGVEAVSEVDVAAAVALVAFVCVESFLNTERGGEDGKDAARFARLAWLASAVGLVLAAYAREYLRAKSRADELEKAPRDGIGFEGRATCVPESKETVQPMEKDQPDEPENNASPAMEEEVHSPSELLDQSTLSAVSETGSVKKRRSVFRSVAKTLVSPVVKLRRSVRSPSKASDAPGDVSVLAKSSVTLSSSTTSPTNLPPSPNPGEGDSQSPVNKISETGPKIPNTLPSIADKIKLDPLRYAPEAPRPPPDHVYENKNTAGYLGYLDEKQTQALEEMRAKQYSCIESRENPPKIIIDDAMLLRFLRARKFNVTKSQAMLEAHLAWRDKYLPSRVTPQDIATVLGSGLSRFGPWSKDGLPVTMIKVEFFDPDEFEGNVDLFVRYVAFFFERAVKRLPNGAEKGLLFFDMKGWSLTKHATRFALRLTAELINIIQAHNPERLDKCILFNTPLIFSGTWTIIKKLLDPVVANKVMFVNNTSAVLELFDKEVLPAEYGGERTTPYPIEGLAELDGNPATSEPVTTS